MRALVTGGSGYIGRHICQAAIEAGWEVVSYDQKEPQVRFHPVRDEWVQGDILDTGLLTTCFQCYPVDLVIHTALIRDVTSNLDEADRASTLNIEGTRSLLWSMASVGCQKLIALTGARAYGFCNQPYIAEDAPLAPQGRIGESLKAAEEMMLEFQQGLPGYVALLRLFEVYGYAHSELFKALGDAQKDGFLQHISQWKNSESSSLYGKDFSTRDGTFVRDYMHISDLTRVVMEASQYIEHESGLICNLGLGKGYSQLDLFKMFEEVFSVEAKVVVKDRRPEEAPRMVANTEYLLAWSGLEFLDLKQGLKLMEQQGSVRTDLQTAQYHPHQNNPPSEAQRI